jgi:hypothetical protein
MPLKGTDDEDNKDWKPTRQSPSNVPQSRDISKQIEKAQRERPNPSC